MNRQKVIELCNSHSLAPNKKLGQNFLVNDAIINKILGALDPKSSDKILEIGPGLGAVSEPLSKVGCPLTLIEIDSGLASYLKESLAGDNVRVIHHDFLKHQRDDDYNKVISNLPYYCASEILFTIAQNYDVDSLYVMIQKEMADRMVAKPGTPTYGALSVTLGLYFDVKYLFNVPSSSFYPRPDVLSGFVELKSHKRYDMAPVEYDLFHKLVKSSFWGRRKQIQKALKSSPHIDLSSESIDKALLSGNIEKSRRGETLNIEDYLSLTKFLRNEYESIK